MKNLISSFFSLYFFAAWSVVALAQDCKMNEMRENGHSEQRLTYDAKGFCTRVDFFKKDNSTDGFEIYTYDAQGKCVQIEAFDELQASIWTELRKFDAQGNMGQLTRSGNGRVLINNVLKYDKASKLIEEKVDRITKKGKRKSEVLSYTWLGDNIEQVQVADVEEGLRDVVQTIRYLYDGKQNPWRGISDGVKGLSANNIVSKKTTNRFNLNEADDSYVQKIEYNAQGFPIKIRREYDSGKANLLEFLYHCK